MGEYNCDVYFHDATFKRIVTELIGECIHGNGVLSWQVMAELEALPRAARKAAVEKPFVNGGSAFFIACIRGSERIVEYFVTACDASLEHTSYCIFQKVWLPSTTPLAGACASGSLSVVRCLIRLGCDVNGLSSAGLTPLHIACIAGNLSIVQYLIENGANMHKKSENGSTCLMGSVQTPQLCDYLLRKGADINARDGRDKTALHYAIEQLYLETTILLMEFGADASAENRDGDDALQTASIRGAVEIANYLITRTKYSPERLADAYELIGASYVHIFNNTLEPVVHWRRAHGVRMLGDVNYIQKRPQIPPRSAFGNVVEFSTMATLNSVATDADAVRIQSLLISERVLGINHEETLRRMMRRGNFYRNSPRSNRCIDLWILVLQVRIEKHSVLHFTTSNTAKSVVRMLLDVSLYDAVSKYPPFKDTFALFQMLATNVIESGPLLNVRPISQEQQLNYGYTVQCLMHLMHLLLLKATSEEDRESLKIVVRSLVQNEVQCTPSKHTLLHLSVSDQNVLMGGYYTEGLIVLQVFPNLQVTQLLLECGAHANALDATRTTPLIFASQLWSFNADIVRALIAHGAHLDLPNRNGDRASKLLAKHPQLAYLESNHISLLCLCANAIIRHGVEYRNRLPRPLKRFVRAHEAR